MMQRALRRWDNFSDCVRAKTYTTQSYHFIRCIYLCSNTHVVLTSFFSFSASHRCAKLYPIDMEANIPPLLAL